MLRKSIVALMMGVICAGSAIAEQPAQKRTKPAPTGLVSWLKSKTTGKSTSGVAASKSRSTKAAANATSSTDKPGLKPGLKTGLKSGLMAGSKTIVRPSVKSTNVGVERAVVKDAERQSVPVRQTAAIPDDAAPLELAIAPAESELQPVPIEMPPVIPKTNTVSGPQYFSATAPGRSNTVPVYPSNNWQTYQAPQQVQRVSQGQYWNASNSVAPSSPVYSGYAHMNPQHGGTYPQTGAALYPTPRPGIPHQVGGITIENPAFHPHEMLYAHQYKAMYPPYYYKVNGGWMVTPFGVWSHEDWKLQGTTVDVKYKSHISPFTHFKPPVIR